MITDGKPSCIRQSDGSYYKVSNGLDQYITNKCYTTVKQARRLHIPRNNLDDCQRPLSHAIYKKFV